MPKMYVIDATKTRNSARNLNGLAEMPVLRGMGSTELGCTFDSADLKGIRTKLCATENNTALDGPFNAVRS